MRLAKLRPDIMRFFPESNNPTAVLPVLERSGTPESGLSTHGRKIGITKKKGSFSMKNSMRFIALSLFVLCFSFTAFAQTTTTGEISGTVIDANGAAVPGITVTAVREGGRTGSATTGPDGTFHISNLEPGNYTVTIEAQKGFGKIEQTNVPVNLGTTSSLAVSLKVAGATEVVDVLAAGGAAIDVTQNTTGTNVSTEQFSNF